MYLNIKSYFIFLLLSLSILSCSDSVSPDEIDPRLIGEWYRADIIQSDTLSPDVSFHGIQINADKTIKLLGVEINTGKIAIWRDNYEKIIKASLGKLIVEHSYYDIGPITETRYYRVDNNKLILTLGNSDIAYTKTKLGNKIFEPVSSNLSLMIDSTAYENEKISFHTTAYAKMMSPTEFSLNADCGNSRLTIEINDFNGEGSYVIPFEKGIWNTSSGDIIAIMISDSITTGSMTITQYNETNNICSGTFYFTAIYPDLSEPYFNKELKEGNFTVPVFK